MSVFGTGSGDMRMSYLNLLIVQLQNQNPLEPMDNNQMAMQLAQLSQLEQMENMSNSFAKSLLVQQVDQASGLIGKQVTYFVPGENDPRTGVVNQVVLIRGQPMLGVGNDAVNPADVILIQEPDAPPPVLPAPPPADPGDNDDDDDDDVVPPIASATDTEDDEAGDEFAAADVWASALAASAATRAYARSAESARGATGLTA
ncbi:MAG: hypothetical protein FWE88_01365 [Phycisphaerae bacterium]|nr:hypothetical protein [Phycisphaerae bacterium]